MESKSESRQYKVFLADPAAIPEGLKYYRLSSPHSHGQLFSVFPPSKFTSNFTVSGDDTQAEWHIFADDKTKRIFKVFTFGNHCSAFLENLVISRWIIRCGNSQLGRDQSGVTVLFPVVQ